MNTHIRPVLAGNWKMNGVGAALDELTAIVANADQFGKLDLVVCLPATLISRAAAVTDGSPVMLGGQDCHAKASGAHTGDISAEMLADAGAGISSLPSNEIYTAMQTGVLDAAVTSTGSFASFNLQEQVAAYTSPTENTFWFMFEPLVITTETFDSLCEEQQEAVVAAGEDLQEYAYQASRDDDARVEQLFTDAGVNVVTMDDAAYQEWVTLAEKQWADFAETIEGGQDLIDMALEAGN